MAAVHLFDSEASGISAGVAHVALPSLFAREDGELFLAILLTDYCFGQVSDKNQAAGDFLES